MSIIDFEKLDFISYPTPFEPMLNLEKEIKSKSSLFIKRDDLTEIGLGGNKNRKLDYLMVEAKEKNADTIITMGGQQSNHCRQTLAYANKMNMDCYLILDHEEPSEYQGNLLFFKIFGAHLIFVTEDEDKEEIVNNLISTLKDDGKTPFFIPVGASVPLGSMGYVKSFEEIITQSKDFNGDIGHIFIASGSAGTQAGLIIGAKLLNVDCKIHGISVIHDTKTHQEKVAKLCNEIASFLNKDWIFEGNDILVYDNYIGEGYAIPTKEGIEAIKLLAKTEAVLLDPVYSGKAMAGMLDLIDTLDNRDICFIHTGGSPAIYNFSKYF